MTSVRVIGNLGEHIAFRLGDHFEFSQWLRNASNAATPLRDVSGSGVDIIWILLDASDPARDLVVIQETKTTGASDLSYAHELTEDYKKLFAVSPRRTLGTRLQDLANYLEYNHAFSQALLHRVVAMGAASAPAATKIRLVPTLIHDAAHDPRQKLLAVRSTIVSMGWTVTAVDIWSIALTNLIDRLDRIAHGAH